MCKCGHLVLKAKWAQPLIHSSIFKILMNSIGNVSGFLKKELAHVIKLLREMRSLSDRDRDTFLKDTVSIDKVCKHIAGCFSYLGPWICC